ncbi:transcriptional regulator [Solitalea canadensis DSM 3403]|uniref:Transcriptional regulator n=2 Tax=Solitalea canadensis TaxID=995 RepID=H8KQ32_SOLCM|nr:transcriptional regulator [Solitalea canadensis DSM 3403]
MELRQLEYFVHAAEKLHFTEAAAAAFITQSTLSQQIKNLEEELGMLLFDRIGKQVRLTEAGQVFLSHAKKILLNVKKAKQAITDLNTLVTGELKIGVSYVFTSRILPSLTSFSAKYPGINIHLEYGPSEELDKKLRASELDLILAFHNKGVDDNLELQPLFRSNIVMVVSKKNKLSELKSVTLKELSQFELILPAAGFSSREFINEVFKKNKIQPKIKMDVNDMHALLSLLKNSDMVGVINEKALGGWDELSAVPIANKSLTRQSFIIWQKDVYRKKAALLFAEELLNKQE